MFDYGNIQTGIYTIYPIPNKEIQVYCEMDKGGWTRIMNRIDDGNSFYKISTEFKIGFGEILGNHWLGFNAIRKILSIGQYFVRFEFERDDFQLDFFEIDLFQIAPETSKYRLTLGKLLKTNINTNFLSPSGKSFSTYDSNSNCANEYQAGWWFGNCIDWCSTCTLSKTYNYGHVKILNGVWQPYKKFKILIKIKN